MQYYKIEKDSQKLRGKVHKENGPQGRLAPALPGHALLFFFFSLFLFPRAGKTPLFPLSVPREPLSGAPRVSPRQLSSPRFRSAALFSPLEK